MRDFPFPIGLEPSWLNKTAHLMGCLMTVKEKNPCEENPFDGLIRNPPNCKGFIKLFYFFGMYPSLVPSFFFAFLAAAFPLAV